MSFVARFLETARRYPNNPAIITGGNDICTYAQLLQQASTIAERLIAQGAGPEDVVGICLEKSAAYVAALLGVWLARAAFVPIDPQMPAKRLQEIARQCAMRRALIGSNPCSLFDGLDVKLIDVELRAYRLKSNTESTEFDRSAGERSGADDRTVRQPENVLRNPPGASSVNADHGHQLVLVPPETAEHDLAYVIFTSGSTGQPKGVMVEHRGIVNLLDAQIKAFALTPESRSLFYLSTSFDASVSDIGTALLSGAALCIEPPGDLQPDDRFADMLARRGITYMDIPPSSLRLLNAKDMPPCLQTIVIGGEACPPATVRAWADRFRVVNVYGPTESTVCTSLVVCHSNSWEKPLIGQPLPGIIYRVLDEDMQEAATDIAGELYISGIGLARGYLHQEALTARKFVTHDGVRLYRTGDRVVRNGDGNYEFLGRCDRQFKLRGLLIEPSEVETRLLEHPDVVRTTVMKRQVCGGTNREILVAYVNTSESSQVTVAELKSHLTGSLPAWMVPQRYEFLASMPVTASGKIDTTALARLALSPLRPNANQSQFQSLQQRILAEVWSQVLAVENLNVDDDFFDIGADSFAVIEVVLAAEARGLTVAPETIMAHRTIRRICQALPITQLAQDPAAPTHREDRRNSAVGGGSAGSQPPPGSETSGSASGPMAAATLRIDVALDAAMVAQLATARLRTDALPSEPAKILLTGATGFLGGRLLAELLNRTTSEIVCLVRADDQEIAKTRIVEALQKHGTVASPTELKRITPICGRLEEPFLGLTQKQWHELSKQIDTVYHLAAHVHMLQSYKELRSPNVAGTMEIARFLYAGRRKMLHYASTLSVFVATDQCTGIAFEADELNNTKFLFGGYAQTKWAAEIFLRSLGNDAGPISYYRLGLITGDAQTGYSSPTDFLSMFVRGIRVLGCVPDSATVDRSTLEVDITPVDFAAQAMARVSLKGMADGQFGTYHIANPQSLSLERLIEALRECGVGLVDVPAGEFTAAFISMLNQAGSSEAAAAALSLCRCLPGSNSFAQFRTFDLFQATGIKFDTRNTDSLLAESGLRCPVPSPALLKLYLERMLATTV